MTGYEVETHNALAALPQALKLVADLIGRLGDIALSTHEARHDQVDDLAKTVGGGILDLTGAVEGLQPLADLAGAVCDGRLKIRVRPDLLDGESIQVVDVWVDDEPMPPGSDR